MGRDKGFHDYVMSDLFLGIDGITSRAMFGGYGFYKHGAIFAIIADGKLYFKVGETNKSDYVQYGSKPFSYVGHNGKSYEMSYWELPENIMEDRREIEIWIEKSLAQNKKKK